MIDVSKIEVNILTSTDWEIDRLTAHHHYDKHKDDIMEGPSKLFLSKYIAWFWYYMDIYENVGLI